jgi:hypothetical protein
VTQRAVHRGCRHALQAREENGEADEVKPGQSAKRRKRAWEESSEEEDGHDSDAEAEAKRLADQREKEEFEERLRLKDEARTRKIAEAKLTKEELEVRTLAVLAGIPCFACPDASLHQRGVAKTGMCAHQEH